MKAVFVAVLLCAMLAMGTATPVVKITEGKGLECTFCELVFTEVYKLLNGNESAAEVEKVLDYVCDVLPGALKSECESLVKQDTPLIIQMILNMESPDALCTALHLCTSSAEPIVKVQPDGEMCTICEYVLTMLDGLLSDNATDQEIIAMVEKVCDFFPGSLKTECDTLVSTYGQEIINYLVKKVSPDQVCAMIGLCTKSTVMAKPASGGELCTVCEMVMGWVEKFVEANATLHEIESFLDNICSILPSSYKTECDALISQYLPVIIQYIENNESPAQFCAQVGLCSKSSDAAPRFPFFH